MLPILLLLSLFSGADANNLSEQKPGIVSAAIVADHDSIVYQSGNLIIKKLSGHSYQHISFLQTESFGRVECNGMVATSKKEAIVFDTPVNDSASNELINYFKSKQYKIKAIIATHFHSDCVGGLAAFHQQGIASYASYKTVALLKNAEGDAPLPKNSFDKTLQLKLGNKKVFAAFYGEGHTKDNVIGYYPADNIMFGGCLIKETDASKGYLGDANVNAWSQTVKIIRANYPKVKIIIPGHGQPGGVALLDYTIELFDK